MEDRATARKNAIGAVVQRDLANKFDAQPAFWKGRSFNDELKFLRGKAASTDPAYKEFVAMNQWYIAQATMYGTAATTDLLEQLIKAIQDRG